MDGLLGLDIELSPLRVLLKLFALLMLAVSETSEVGSVELEDPAGTV